MLAKMGIFKCILKYWFWHEYILQLFPSISASGSTKSISLFSKNYITVLCVDVNQIIICRGIMFVYVCFCVHE